MAQQGGGVGGGAAAAVAAPLPPLPAPQPAKIPSEVAAEKLILRLRQLRVPLTNCVTVMADNSFFADAVARILGLHRSRCAAHILALSFEEVAKQFKLFILCTSGLSALINAGGGTARREAIRGASLVPTSLHCATTRWCQCQDSATYLLQKAPAVVGKPTERVFDVVYRLLSEHPAFQPRKKLVRRGAAAAAALVQPPGGGGAAAAAAGGGGGGAAAAAADAAPPPIADADDDEEEDGEEVQVAGRGKVPVGKLMAEVKSAFGVTVGQRRNFGGLLELLIVNNVLAAKLPLVLTNCSANIKGIPVTMASQLEELREVWGKIVRSPFLASLPVNVVLTSLDPQAPAPPSIFPKIVFTPNEKLLLTNKYSPHVLTACINATKQYDKYMPVALEQLERRRRFEPSIQPDPLVVPLGQFITIDM